jgi:predicted nucleic acid-binding protein
MLDALHLAAAMENRAGVFLSNDTELRRVREIKVLTLSDYLGTAGAA